MCDHPGLGACMGNPLVLTPPHHRFRLMRSSHHGPRLYFVGARAICPIYALFGRHYDRRGQWGSDALLRVAVLIALASATWVPIEVAVGLRPKLTERVQPIAQFLAALPANLLFPVASF